MVSQNTENKKERTGVAEGVYAIEDSQAMFEAIGSAGAAGDQLSEAASDDKDFDGMLNADGEFDPRHLTDVLPYGDTTGDNGENFPAMDDSIPELTEDDKKFVVDEFAKKLQEMGTTQIDDPQITALAVTIKGENGFPQDIEGFLRETINNATTRIGAQNVSNALPSGAKPDDIAPLADGNVPASVPSQGSEFAPAMTSVPSTAPTLTPNVDGGVPGADGVAGQGTESDMNLGLDGLGNDPFGTGENASEPAAVATGLEEPKSDAVGKDSEELKPVDAGKESEDDSKKKSRTEEPKKSGTDTSKDEKKSDEKPDDDLGLNLGELGDSDFSPDATDDDKSGAPKTESVGGKAKMEGELVAECGKACGTQTDCQCKDGKACGTQTDCQCKDGKACGTQTDCQCKDGKACGTQTDCQCKDGKACGTQTDCQCKDGKACVTTLEAGEDASGVASIDTEGAPDEGGTETECELGKIRDKYMESIQSSRKAKMESAIAECKAKVDIEHRLESKIVAKIEAIRARYAGDKRTAKLEAICKRHNGVDSLVADCRNAKNDTGSAKPATESIPQSDHVEAKTESVAGSKVPGASTESSVDRKLSAILEGICKDATVDSKLNAIVNAVRKDAELNARFESIAADTRNKMSALSEKKKISAKFDALLAKKKA